MPRELIRVLGAIAVATLLPACGGGGSAGDGGAGAGGTPPPGSSGWTLAPGDPVLSMGIWDASGVFFPSVVHPSASSYSMWYEGYQLLYVAVGTSPSSPSPSQALSILPGPIVIRSIGQATSSDGLAWTKSGTTPVLSAGISGAWDSGGVGTPCLLPKATADRMWYTGWGVSSTAIGLATYDNVAMAWTHSASPVLSGGTGTAWDSSGVISPCVLYDGTTYRMWYVAGTSDLGPGPGIGLAESTDGTTWTKSDVNPVLLPGSSGAPDQDGLGSAWVVQDGETFRMWYAGWKGGTPVLCYASSPDGTHWTKYPENPILQSGAAGSWTSQGVYAPCVLLEGTTFRMWMTGRNDFQQSQIGYASNP